MKVRKGAGRGELRSSRGTGRRPLTVVPVHNPVVKFLFQYSSNTEATLRRESKRERERKSEFGARSSSFDGATLVGRPLRVHCDLTTEAVVGTPGLRTVGAPTWTRRCRTWFRAQRGWGPVCLTLRYSQVTKVRDPRSYYPIRRTLLMTGA